MNTKNKLGEMPIRPLLYTMAIPLMLSLLVQSLYNIVDSIFVARLSETALTAASLVYSIQFLMIAVGVGTAVGLNALLSRKIGERKTGDACQAATTILCGYFASGLGNGIINMVSAAIRQLVLLVPFLWIFINLWGISRGWYAFWIAESIACIYSYLSSHQLLKILRNTSRTNGPTKNT